MKKSGKYFLYTTAFILSCFAFSESHSEAKQPEITLRTTQHTERKKYGFRTNFIIQGMRHHRILA